MKYIKKRINNKKVNYWASIQRDKRSNGAVLKCFHFKYLMSFLKERVCDKKQCRGKGVWLHVKFQLGIYKNGQQNKTKCLDFMTLILLQITKMFLSSKFKLSGDLLLGHFNFPSFGLSPPLLFKTLKPNFLSFLSSNGIHVPKSTFSSINRIEP